MPATAHGLQNRFNARTVTESKFRSGHAPSPGRPATVCLLHGLYRSLHSLTMEVFAGLSLGCVSFVIRVSFYSIFKLQGRPAFTSGQVDPRLYAFRKPVQKLISFGTAHRDFFKYFSMFRSPRSMARRTTFSFTPSALAMSVLLMPRMKWA